MATQVIYPDPALAPEYTAGAWAAALQARRRTHLLAAFIAVVIVPVCAAAYALGYSQIAVAAENAAASAVQDVRTAQMQVRFDELNARLQEVEGEVEATDSVAPTSPSAARGGATPLVAQAAQPPATVVVAPQPTQIALVEPVVPTASAPAPHAPTSTTSTSTTVPGPVRACVLGVCVAVG